MKFPFGIGDHDGRIDAAYGLDFEGHGTPLRAVGFQVSGTEKHSEKFGDLRDVVWRVRIAEARVMISPIGIIAIGSEIGVSDVGMNEVVLDRKKCLLGRFAQKYNVAEVDNEPKIRMRFLHAPGNFPR